MDPHRVLVVDDESTIRRALQRFLTSKGCDARAAGTAEEGLRLMDGWFPEVALLDIVMPGMNGLDMLAEVKRTSPETEVVMITSHASVDTAVRAIRDGAYDYLQKPFDDIQEVWLVVRRALERRRLAVANLLLLEEQEQRNRELDLVVTKLSSLIDAGRAMADFRSLPELLDFFVGLVAEELGVDRASLMLVDEDGGRLYIAASRGLEDVDVEEIRTTLGDGIAGRVAETGEPFLVTDATSDPRVPRSGDPSLSDSFISAPIVFSIPIKSRGKVLGVINVTNRRSGQAFDENDLSYVSGLAGQLAVAIERARHVEELRGAYESLRRTQSELVASERIMAVGQTAAGVAHDFNNALCVILGRAGVMLTRLQDPSPDVANLRSDVDVIRRVSLQAAETIRRIQSFTKARKSDPAALPVDLNRVVKDAVEITRSKWKTECEAQGREVELRFDLGEIPTIRGNVHELTQAVDNLIFNAVEAMPKGGRLGFRTWTDGDSVMLEVSDTGVGMSEETRQQIFRPFFTTKERGNGLGTSIVHWIVTQHGGEVAVESAPGRGTTFRLRLPRLLRDREDPVSGDSREAAGTGPPARLLIVEDDPLIRDTYVEGLRGTGHEVRCCASGKEALSIFERDRFDLAITDLSMPGMTGLEVARRLKRIDPELPVVLLSGWAVHQEEFRAGEAGVDHILSKPILIEDLIEAVRRHRRTPVTV